ncbi:MAG: alkaline phosphatase family protein [Chloroflexales bacterium]|nr:alkaline phosphatase family protein [Chloroflexales bacterium]
MIVLVMIDGTRPDALDQARCPNIQALRERGSATMQARSVMPSITLPCHTSIFHSVPPSRHGITANLYLPMARPLPGLVEVARGAGLRSAFVHNWEPLRDLNRPETLAYSYYREPPLTPDYDQAVADEAARLLAHERFDFVFVYFGSVDGAGHLYGWMSPEQIAQIERVDAHIGQLLAALPADATIIVHADHGGHERTHGTEMPEDMTIPWIAAGPTIRRGHTIAAPVSLLDTAPTIARLLGLRQPTDWEGSPVEEIFT